MKLRYTERAIADLEAIQSYITEHNPTASVAVGVRIRAAIENLADFPGIGRARDAKTRVLPIVTYPYAVYYSVDDKAKEVVIIHIRHGRRRPVQTREL
jgi:toxin ParE1/3/4